MMSILSPHRNSLNDELLAPQMTWKSDCSDSSAISCCRVYDIPYMSRWRSLAVCGVFLCVGEREERGPPSHLRRKTCPQRPARGSEMSEIT